MCSLTRGLASGADLKSSPEHALRAAQLTSDRHRKQLARSLRRTIIEAHRVAPTRAAIVIINRHAVLDTEHAITALVSRLINSEPVSPEGMALVKMILTNGDSSPLYNASKPGALRREVLIATAPSTRRTTSCRSPYS